MRLRNRNLNIKRSKALIFFKLYTHSLKLETLLKGRQGHKYFACKEGMILIEM